jgi:hypothetical protein
MRSCEGVAHVFHVQSYYLSVKFCQQKHQRMTNTQTNLFNAAILFGDNLQAGRLAEPLFHFSGDNGSGNELIRHQQLSIL